MKLFMHNILKSNAPLAKLGYPLKLEIGELREVKIEFDPNNIKNLMTKIDYDVLYEASRLAGYFELPEKLPPFESQDEELLKKLHHALLEIDVVEGSLACPDTGHKYSIHESIPDMIIA